MVAVQRTSSDLKLNPHVHAVFLEGTYRDKGEALDFRVVGHLSTRDVAAVLERTRDRMVKDLRRRGLLVEDGDAEGDGDGLVGRRGHDASRGAGMATRRAAFRAATNGVRALVTDPTSVARYLRGIGEPTDVPKRTPARGPPYWASRVLRRSASSVEAAE